MPETFRSIRLTQLNMRSEERVLESCYSRLKQGLAKTQKERVYLKMSFNQCDNINNCHGSSTLLVY